MAFNDWSRARLDGPRDAAWALAIALWVCAISLARDEKWVLAIALMALNFEIFKRSRNANSFVEYLNTIFFHMVLYFYLEGFSIELGKFRFEAVLVLEAAIVSLINIRYRFLSLKAMISFLILASAVSFPFTLWHIVYVPHGMVRGFSAPFVFYRYWMTPVQMLLVTAPFLFTALADDLRAIRNDPERSAMLDVYYCYTLPLLAFGLFPGVGVSLQANCDLNSTYVAIGGIVMLVVAGLTLSLVTNRKSILLASALAALPLGFNRCVQVPFSEVVLVACIVMLLAWRWLPKGPARSG
jgi:hypothetical protein